MSLGGSTINLSESSPLTTIVAANSATDDDSDTLTYSCWFDDTGSGSVIESEATKCNGNNLRHITFNQQTGELKWNPNNGQDGNYKFKIVVTDNQYVATDFVDVNIDNNRVYADCSSVLVNGYPFQVIQLRGR